METWGSLAFALAEQVKLWRDSNRGVRLSDLSYKESPWQQHRGWKMGSVGVIYNKTSHTYSAGSV